MRPFFIVGHNTRDLTQVNQFLDAGANAVEPDIWLNERTGELHAANESDMGPRAQDFLFGLGQLARKRPQLALVVLDCKPGTVSGRNGARLLRWAREGLAGTGVSVIISVASLSEAAEFGDILHQLGPREAIMVDQDSNTGAVAHWFWERGVTRGCYGNQFAASSIDHAIALKVQRALPRWVYIYTYSSGNAHNLLRMRDEIRAGVDGIIVDLPAVPALVGLVADSALQVRLATPKDDDPLDPMTAPHGYSLYIQTLDRKNAGTDANVTFTLRGQKGELQTVISGDTDWRFERGHFDHVSLFGDVGAPLSLSLSHDGSGDSPEWLPDFIHVRRTGDPAVYGAGFGDWLKAGASDERALGVTRYSLKVSTGGMDHAGTDADLFFTLAGPLGRITRRVNGARQLMFERGSVDDVHLVGPDIGEPMTLSIFNDGSGGSPRWFLDRVELRRNEDPIFICFFNRWIDSGATETELASRP